ncbi:His-rich protein BRANT [Bradyrhizobium cenepequi]
MLKTISAALLAVSVMAAPAFAGSYGKTTHAPVIKSELTKSKALNANAKMVRHHHKHYRYVRHHGHHKHIGVIKTHVTPKVAVKHIVRPAKRG